MPLKSESVHFHWVTLYLGQVDSYIFKVKEYLTLTLAQTAGWNAEVLRKQGMIPEQN